MQLPRAVKPFRNTLDDLLLLDQQQAWSYNGLKINPEKGQTY